MSSIEQKKLKTIERLLNSDDENILDRVIELLDQEHIITSYFIPDEHYSLLKEDHEKYLKGELETSSFEDVEARIKKKYGL